MTCIFRLCSKIRSDRGRRQSRQSRQKPPPKEYMWLFGICTGVSDVLGTQMASTSNASATFLFCPIKKLDMLASVVP